MARYIDAEKLGHLMYENAFKKDTDLQRWDNGCWIRYKLFEQVVKRTPTEDVKPVKRAYWKEEPSYMEEDGSVEYHITCSNCNELYTIMGWQKGDYKYCPNCGAKMEEEE